MSRHERSAPIWLFSFVDLAFLLLIAFTQIGPDLEPDAPDLAQIEVPRITGTGEPLAAPSPAPVWQLRIHPVPVASAEREGSGDERTNGDHRPYELIEPPGSEASLRMAAAPEHGAPAAAPGTGAPIEPAATPANGAPIEPAATPGRRATDATQARRIDAAELAAHLKLLHERRLARPVLAPHRDSRSEDLLVAVDLLERSWQETRQVAVRPMAPVASPPGPDAGGPES